MRHWLDNAQNQTEEKKNFAPLYIDFLLHVYESLIMSVCVKLGIMGCQILTLISASRHIRIEKDSCPVSVDHVHLKI